MIRLISQCAEAKIFREKNLIIKDRVEKGYRLKKLDDNIRLRRTRNELKILAKASDVIPVPRVFQLDNQTKIKMEFIKGKKVADILDKLKNRLEVCNQIGKNLAILHNNNIIHGDLTTSNMILNKKDNKLYFIDFGLSYIDEKIEHKAVDLHLLKQAFESKHWKHFDSSFKLIIESYKKYSKDSDKILERFDIVELRGRYKHK